MQESIVFFLFIRKDCDVLNVENLLVPFYTTKEKGSGIGLVFSRHIAEAHNGQLLLINRIAQSGCKA